MTSIKLITHIKCTHCNQYLPPITEDEFMNENHPVHKCPEHNPCPKMTHQDYYYFVQKVTKNYVKKRYHYCFKCKTYYKVKRHLPLDQLCECKTNKVV